MKKSDLKSAKAVNYKESMTKLDKENLKNTGRSFGIRLWVGDEITFLDWDELEVYSDVFTGRDNQEHSFPVVKVGFNDKARVIPVGTFRRFTSGISEYIEQYAHIDDFHRDIVSCQDDFELMQIFAGKTVRVRDYFDARTVKFDDDHKLIAYNERDVKTFNTAKWPIFEIVK